MLKNDIPKNGTSRMGLYLSAPPPRDQAIQALASMVKKIVSEYSLGSWSRIRCWLISSERSDK